ncbi:evolutionarily conserved signaling intermediate in Toll pathway, mitochondrial-like [Salvelinus alpinus]|uniref:evolutionarily conserved signaling intermediate in Toll pathway, mitochondrial n=1 Tax=Salvelinus sp. IW2-2015 TaxID=2691554 RepID=UPI000CDF7ABC|nr:evolutionarily conserved signaling intermediate in Toll pathway, mitochondrial [Salvelinus alpinus]
MNCARCLLRLQSVGFLAPSVRAAALLQPATALSQITVHNTCGQALRRFHGSPGCYKSQPVPTDPGEAHEDRIKKDKSLITHDDLFERVAREAKTKATFNRVVDVFSKRDIRRRGHVEFIYAALKKMPEFGVERDLTVYNKLLDVFPKEVFVPRNFIQRMFNHYPRQQECGVQLLEQMENYGIMPNVESKVLIVQIFGDKSHPMRKYQRIMYWFPKFKHANPFPVPLQLPEDPVDLARLSLNRIANDLDAKVTVYQMPCTDISESGEEITFPHVVGIQSPDQMELLAKHNPNRPVFVEGPFPLWLRKICVYYYILRADPLPPEEKVEEPYDPERCFDYPLQLDLDLDRDMGDDDSFNVEDVDEGPVFAMCMTSQGDQATLNQWISGLQETNPILGRVPTLFRLEAGPRELQGVADPGPGYREEGEEEAETQTEVETDIVVEEEHRRSQGVKQ